MTKFPEVKNVSRKSLQIGHVLTLVAGLMVSCLYVKFMFPFENNLIDFKASFLSFLLNYMATSLGLVVFANVRKTDIASYCWLMSSSVLLGQFAFAKLGLAPYPYFAQAAAGWLGILATLVPMYVAKVRQDRRQARADSSLITTHRNMHNSSPSTEPADDRIVTLRITTN